MDTVIIKTKEYQVLQAVKARLEALSNTKRKKHHSTTRGKSFADLIGVLSDVPELKGKMSVEVQHMIPALWNGKRS